MTNDDIATPKELGALCWKWLQEDPCFANIAVFCSAFDHEDPEVPGPLQELISEYEKHCQGRCAQNIRLEQELTPDPLKKTAYHLILQDFMVKWLRSKGIKHTIARRPEGLSHRMEYPATFELPLPFVGIEYIKPFDRSQKARVIYDAQDEQTFRDPGRLIQYLDETAAREVRGFPSKAGSLHWRSIIGDHEAQLWIRWDGELKQLAPDWTLHARYGALVGKRLERPSNSDPNKEPGTGEESLRLRELAMEYHEERSWFAGFLNQTLRFRGIDEHRRGSRDSLAAAETGMGEDDPEREGREKLEFITHDERQGLPAHNEEELARRVDQQRIPDLLGELSARDRRILQLKMEKKSDGQIGQALGLRRETVNRVLARIKSKAKKMFG